MSAVRDVFDRPHCRLTYQLLLSLLGLLILGMHASIHLLLSLLLDGRVD